MVNVNNILDLMPLHKLILLSPADNTKPLVVLYFFMFSSQFNKQWSQQWLTKKLYKKKEWRVKQEEFDSCYQTQQTATVKNKTKNSLSANHTLTTTSLKLNQMNTVANTVFWGDNDW